MGYDMIVIESVQSLTDSFCEGVNNESRIAVTELGFGHSFCSQVERPENTLGSRLRHIHSSKASATTTR